MFFRRGFGCNEGKAEQGVVAQRIGMREVSGSELGHDTVNTTWCVMLLFSDPSDICRGIDISPRYRLIYYFFFLGGGGGLTRGVYNLCLTLKVCYENHVKIS
jgi:hypothetical protein